MSWAELYQIIRGVLELLQFISSVVLAGVGLLVIKQIRLAKASLTTAQDDLRIRIKREAVVLAARLTEKYAESILSQYNDLIDAFDEAKITTDRWKLENNHFDENSIRDLNKANAWLRSVRAAGKQNMAIEVLNAHEAFAIYFVGQAADERIAFPSIAPVFCDCIETLAPTLLSLRNKGLDLKTVSGPYQNTVTLYDKWASRLRKQSLDAEAAKLQASSSEIHITDIPILGLGDLPSNE